MYEIQVLVLGKWIGTGMCSAVEADAIALRNDPTVRLVRVRK